ncbi:MAG: hypothetical protein HWE30_17815 [Methylocystaceae bacterium]|nr:hypothetical protein [Methylocystaceae bacterium]
MAFVNPFKKKKTDELIEENDLPANDHDHSPVQEKDPYRWEVAHRRLAWMVRICVVLIVVLACTTVAAIEAIVSIAESYQPKIALLRVDPKDDKLYRVEPIHEDVEGFDMLMEAKARRYVRLMLERDNITQTERFKEAFRMTDTRYYEKFKKEQIDSGEIREFLNAGGIRSITVESLNAVENDKGVYKYAVDYTRTDLYNGKPRIDPKTGEPEKPLLARAYLEMTTRPHEVKEIDKYENPLGITVLDMSLKKRANK